MQIMNRHARFPQWRPCTELSGARGGRERGMETQRERERERERGRGRERGSSAIMGIIEGEERR